MKQESELHKAIVEVMKEVKNIEKSLNVGAGSSSYKGVADKDVKFVIGTAMAKNNLTCLPIKIEPKTTIERWQEVDPYSKSTPKDLKTKQQVFTEVLGTYLITHAISGESVTIQGFGYGVDTQDKSAGKATTYALKNALLYSYLVPTGEIDDTDNTHSNAIEPPKSIQLPGLTDEQISNSIAKGTQQTVIAGNNVKWQLTAEQLKKLQA